ncbi:recQ-mediated genome instability protein 1-like isoform X3 [Physella acuta]|uniref:recQ-mediated genome instability protein 1-like isoform X1 n=1 Tax=Physella acuta TaxID=109671 RepID=UPI0027DB815A|nr:recQ-mediated genome instability protein 1-like isoform X1 [Physella acuta]XP_059153883.1 recQ-mediated genome instability protein 1-like isoform X2 [Physella acuta]XP_059153884.1 recQ-mediated genome instability protein 1-like isoform X3 [Physella acuta]
METVAAIHKWLKSDFSIQVSSEWLAACVEWIQQEHQGQELPAQELRSLVYEQWLVSDLSEVSLPQLPADAASADHTKLGQCSLQLISLVDVGSPLYGQKERLQGRLNPNVDVSADKPFQPAWEPKPRRMLLLQLTDGHTHIQAMEYQTIKELHEQLPSGTKVLLSGDLECWSGIIVLRAGNIHVLGGEVDALSENNTPLANIDRAMLQHREYAGEHRKREFSGRFITRVSAECKLNMKLDSSQIKQETKYGSRSQHGSLYRQEVKAEISSQPSFLSRQSFVKIESNQNSLMERKKDIHDLSDEVDDLFEDDIDLQEIDAMESSARQRRSVPALCDSSPADVPSLATCQMRPIDEDVDMFDDDIELTEINLAMDPQSVQQNQREEKTSCYPLFTKSYPHRTENKQNCDRPSPDVAGVNQAGQMLTHGAMARGKRNPLFKTKPDSSSTSSVVRTEGSGPAKKQCKLSDMFGGRALSEHSSFKVPSTIVVDGLDHPAVCPRADMSLHATTSTFSPVNTALKHTNHSTVTSPYSNVSKLPKAVIRPFCDTPATDECVAPPFRYLSELSSLKPPALLTVKAYISTLTNKLGCAEGNQWTLSCRINDGTATLDVDFSNDVLTKLIGFTAEESLMMRQKAKTDPGQRQIVTQGLYKCQQKLINISCLMDVAVSGHGLKPVVTRLAEVSREQVDSLLQVVETCLSQHKTGR